MSSTKKAKQGRYDDLKKLIAPALILILCLAVLPAFAADTVSSATINMTQLPDWTANPDASSLVVFFSPDDTVKAVA